MHRQARGSLHAVPTSPTCVCEIACLGHLLAVAECRGVHVWGILHRSHTCFCTRLVDQVQELLMAHFSTCRCGHNVVVTQCMSLVELTHIPASTAHQSLQLDTVAVVATHCSWDACQIAGCNSSDRHVSKLPINDGVAQQWGVRTFRVHQAHQQHRCDTGRNRRHGAERE
jgi:hypothetical protein